MKKRTITKFIVTSVLVVLGLFLSIFSFDLGIYTYNGFANSIQKGMDVGEGVVAVYNVKNNDDNETNFNQNVDKTIQKISTLITSQYEGAIIIKQGDGLDSTQIRVEVPNVNNPENILELLGQPQKLEIKKENSATAEAILTEDHIELSQAGVQNGEYGVSVLFTEEGKVLFADLTRELAANQGTLYMFIGGELYSQATVQSEINTGSTFISGNLSTFEQAQEFATRIMSASFKVDLNIDLVETVSPSYGYNILTLAIIGVLIGLAIIFIAMYVLFKDLGLIAILSTVIYSILMLFFMQAIPLIELTLSSIAGICLAFGMFVYSLTTIFGRMKEEYKQGKKIPVAVQAGFKNTYKKIIDISAAMLIFCLVLFMFGINAIQNFVVTFAVGTLLSMFVSLVLTRVFCKWYLNLNSKNPKKLNFKREANIDEIK